LSIDFQKKLAYCNIEVIKIIEVFIGLVMIGSKTSVTVEILDVEI
jgi:hypothetical protein